MQETFQEIYLPEARGIRLFERLKPLWEAAEKIGEVDPEFDSKAFMDEIWEVEHEEPIALWEARDSLGIRDADLAADVEKQFKLIAAAYGKGDALKIDRVIDRIATIRRIKRLGFYEPGDPSD